MYVTLITRYMLYQYLFVSSPLFSMWRRKGLPAFEHTKEPAPQKREISLSLPNLFARAVLFWPWWNCRRPSIRQTSYPSSLPFSVQSNYALGETKQAQRMGMVWWQCTLEWHCNVPVDWANNGKTFDEMSRSFERKDVAGKIPQAWRNAQVGRLLDHRRWLWTAVT